MKKDSDKIIRAVEFFKQHSQPETNENSNLHGVQINSKNVQFAARDVNITYVCNPKNKKCDK